jgi:hypothetical protein
MSSDGKMVGTAIAADAGTGHRRIIGGVGQAS